MEITIIIPTYKPGSYIFELLEALSNQTMLIDDYEVLIVLNGEKEPYFSDLEKYILNKSCHIKLLYHTKKGVSEARNFGIEQSKGKYLCFIDDDDIVSLNYIESLYSRVKADAIVVSNFRNFHDNIEVNTVDYIGKCFAKNCRVENISLLSGRSFFSSACGKLIPHNIIGNRQFDKRYSIGEDAMFMMSISNSIKDIYLSDISAIYYRRLRYESASRLSRGIFFEIKNMLKLTCGYSRIFFSNPRKYDFLFFAMRILAVLKGSIIRIIK